MEQTKILEELGLDERKSKVYFALLELGVARVQDIAKKAGMERTGMYDLLNQLVRVGLAGVTMLEKRRAYFALEPEKVLTLFDEKRARISKLIPELQAVYNLHKTKPKIRFYEGVAGVKQVFENILTTQERQLFAILSMYETFEFLGAEYMDDHIARRVKNGIHLKVIRSRQKEVPQDAAFQHWLTDPKALRELRYAPEKFVFAMNQYVYDHKVALVSSRHEGFGLIIESQEYSNLQRSLFQALWEISQPQK